MFYAFLMAFGLGAAGALVTIIVNVPINKQIAGWNPMALPPEYEDVLRRWWDWHMVRLITSVGALCCVLAALTFCRSAVLDE